MSTKIFNVDESRFPTVTKKCRKILAQKRKQQIGSVASGEHGLHITMFFCAGVAGHYVAPMIIFRNQNGQNQILELGRHETAMKLSSRQAI